MCSFQSHFQLAHYNNVLVTFTVSGLKYKIKTTMLTSCSKTHVHQRYEAMRSIKKYIHASKGDCCTLSIYTMYHDN